MLLEIFIAAIAIISWPLIFALYYSSSLKKFFNQRFDWGRSKPSKSHLPPLSLPLRYDEVVKKSPGIREEILPDSNVTKVEEVKPVYKSE